MDITSKVTTDQLTASEFMQIVTELEGLIESAGIVLAPGTLTQVSFAVADYAGGSDFYTDGGGADAYVLTPIGSKKGPQSYANGLRVRFRVGAANTGASTVNVNALGAKNITQLDGTVLVVGDLVLADAVTLVYDSVNNRFWIESSQSMRNSRSVPGTVNIGFDTATAVDADDTIVIRGSNGAALSVTNPGYITLPGAVPGELTTFLVTANVTILLTGAHWGLGTHGDQTDYILHVFGLNDNGTLKWGVGAVGSLDIILAADDSSTPTDINQLNEVLVNTALGANSQAMEIGWIKANFTDVGDIWAIQTGDQDLNIGICGPVYKPWYPSSTWTTNTTIAASWMKQGSKFYALVQLDTAGVPDNLDLTVDTPLGLVIDTDDLLSTDTEVVRVGECVTQDAAAAPLMGTPVYEDTNTVEFEGKAADATYVYFGARFSRTVPHVWGAGDQMYAKIELPIVGW